MSERATPRYGHRNIKLVRRGAWGAIDAWGQFSWQLDHQGRRALILAIPANPTGRFTLSRWTIDHKNDCGAQWSWDGNEDTPTLSPSLHAVGVWHGWVRKGWMVEA